MKRVQLRYLKVRRFRYLGVQSDECLYLNIHQTSKKQCLIDRCRTLLRQSSLKKTNYFSPANLQCFVISRDSITECIHFYFRVCIHYKVIRVKLERVSRKRTFEHYGWLKNFAFKIKLNRAIVKSWTKNADSYK